jgi:hypothetical protein
MLVLFLSVLSLDLFFVQDCATWGFHTCPFLGALFLDLSLFSLNFSDFFLFMLVLYQAFAR